MVENIWFWALFFFTSGALLIMGYQDRKEYQISGKIILPSIIIFCIFYIGFFITYMPYTVIFLVAGIVLSGCIAIVLLNQLQPIDLIIIFLTSIAFLPAMIPAFLLTEGITAIRRELGHPFIWLYSINFISICILELLILYFIFS